MRRTAVCILIITLAIFLSACAGPSRTDKDHGRSVKQARVNQILDPEAGRNLEPVTGLDGKAAQGGIEKYRKTFEGSRGGGQPLVQPGTPVGKAAEGSGYSK